MSSPKSDFRVTFHGVTGSIASPRGPDEIRSKLLGWLSHGAKRLEKEIFSKLSKALPIESEERLARVLRQALQKSLRDFPLWLEELPIGEKGTYGGNTSCVEVRAGDAVIIMDAGTGLRNLGLQLVEEAFGQGEGEALLLVSHTHIDHIIGWPFFLPAYVKGNLLHIWGPPMRDAIEEKSLREVFDSIMQWYFFPVFLNEMGARLEFRDLFRGTYRFKEVTITATPMYHPVWTLGYRLEWQGKSLVYETDSEAYSSDESDPHTIKAAEIYNEAAVDLAENADLFICDAQYTPEEYEPEKFGRQGVGKKGWGHLTYEHSVERAKAANAKLLVLFHHEPQHSDRFLDQKTERAKAFAEKIGYRGKILSAYEGLTLHL